MEKIQYPEYEVSNKNAELEAERKAAENRMREQEDKARRDRDMAIFGDVANLFAQGAALHVGGKNIEKTPSAAAVGNERLRKLQESNSKQMAEYARQQIETRDAERKERNAQKLAQYNAELAQYKRDLEAEKYTKEQDRKDKQDALKAAETASVIEKNKAYADYYNSGGEKTSGGRSGNFLKITMPDGTEKTFSKKELGDNWINYTYEELVKAGMPRAMKYKVNPLTGLPEPYEDTSLAGRKAYMETWSAGNAHKGNSWDGWKDGNATEDIDEDFE